MPARKYSDDLLNEVANMREGGASFRTIATKFNMSEGAVSWHCLRLGADSPNTIKNIDPPKGPAVVKRGNHVVKRFTPQEDQILLRMDAEGRRVCDMARATGRKENSIRGRLMILARREARKEDAR